MSRPVAACATVFNEISHFDLLEASIVNASRVLDCISIVDAGSTDGTYERLQALAARLAADGCDFKLLQIPGANISAGRNAAVSMSRCRYALVFDAGCRLSDNWAEALQDKLVPGALVKGISMPLLNGNIWHDGASKALGKRRSTQMHPTTPGSSRCMAFDVNLFDMVGGYPVTLPTAEDTVFWNDIVRHSKPIVAPESLAYWSPGVTAFEVLKKHYRYGQGDGLAKIHSKTMLGPAIYTATVLGANRGRVVRLIVSAAVATYLVRRLRGRRLACREVLPGIVAVVGSDFAHAMGYMTRVIR